MFLSLNGRDFDQLISPLRPELLHFAEHCLGSKNSHLGEDVIQDVMITMFMQWPEWDPNDLGAPENCARAWAFRSVSNRVADYWRKEKSKARLDTALCALSKDQFFAPPVVDGFDITADEFNEPVDKAISRLDTQAQVLIRDYYLHGRTIGQIAQKLGLPENTARVKILRARDKLAPLLASYAAKHHNLGSAREHTPDSKASQMMQTYTDGVDSVMR